jgi:hypothetical protein
MAGVMHVELSKTIWEFVKPILNDSLKECLKLKSPDERAKEKVFAFYNSLRLLNESSLSFVSALEVFAQSPSDEPAKMLRTTAEALVKALGSFQNTHERLEPQLDISLRHADAFPSYIGSIKLIRDRAARIAADTLENARAANSDELKRLATSARENHERLSEAIENFRAFVAADFAFKETF